METFEKEKTTHGKWIENISKINKPVLLRSDVFAEINKRKIEIYYRRRLVSYKFLKCTESHVCEKNDVGAFGFMQWNEMYATNLC